MNNPENVHNYFLTSPVSNLNCIYGSVNSEVVLVFYGDYQCSGSAHVNALIQTVQQQYEICIVFRHFPQPHLYPQSQRAAEAVEAAGAQGQFWPMHHLLFARQDALNNGNLVEYAIEIRLDGMRFLRELSQHVHAAKIRDDYQSGIASGVEQALACFINSIRYAGAWDEASLIKMIETVIEQS
jgi:protein-disulfide isomerase